MKPLSEEKVRQEASAGKNKPMAKEPRVDPQQNGEAEPTRAAAKKQPGTDEAKRAG